MKKTINHRILKDIAIVISLFFFYMAYLLLNESETEIIGMIMPKGLEFLPLLISGLLIVLHILEYASSKPIGRSIYLGIVILICIFVGKEQEILNLYICLFGLIYLITTIVSTIMCKPRERDALKMPGKISVGYFSKKQEKNTQRAIYIMLIIMILLILLNAWLEFINMILLVVILIPLLLFFVFFVSISNNPLNTILFKINNECNYEKFVQEIEKLDFQKLHPETINYLMALKCNYTYYIDPLKANEMFVTINKPTFKSFKPIYNVLEIVFYLNSREFDIAKSIIEKHKINKTISKKNLEITERIFIIEDKNRTIDNIF